MCLIVDNSVRDRVFLKPDDKDFGKLHSCLFGKGRPAVMIVYGGKLKREYFERDKIKNLLRELVRAGRARIVDDGQVDQEMAIVIASGLCRSDDEHIIALARVAKVRLLCTDDGDLKRDFSSKTLINHVRGKVYGHARHKHLLERFCGNPNTQVVRRRRR